MTLCTAADLRAMSNQELRHVLIHGHPIAPERLDNTMYKGVSLGLPGWMVKLTWLTFRKTFYRCPDSQDLRGWNVRMEQTGLEGARHPRTRNGKPQTFGHYHVVSPTEHLCPFDYQGLLIHYGVSPNSTIDPVRRVRDPLVAVNEGSTELLLGWSYLDLGVGQIGTPSYFTLEYEGALDYVPDALRGRSTGGGV